MENNMKQQRRKSPRAIKPYCGNCKTSNHSWKDCANNPENQRSPPRSRSLLSTRKAKLKVRKSLLKFDTIVEEEDDKSTADNKTKCILNKRYHLTEEESAGGKNPISHDDEDDEHIVNQKISHHRQTNNQQLTSNNLLKIACGIIKALCKFVMILVSTVIGVSFVTFYKKHHANDEKCLSCSSASSSSLFFSILRFIWRNIFGLE